MKPFTQSVLCPVGRSSNPSRSRLLPLTLLALIASLLHGCATYSDELGEAFAQADGGHFEAAQEEVDQVLDPEGDDRLLFFMEKGVLAHWAGNYETSIELLGEAELVGEELYTEYFRDGVRSALSNPRNAPYRGSIYELIYIHYFQALNFTMQAQESDDSASRRRYLDGALIETRKLDARLNELSIIHGEYQAPDDEEDDELSTMASMLQLFHGFSSEIADRDSLRVRDAAWLRYLTGVLYEMSGEQDNARIAYQRAADTYENGYADQYELDHAFMKQAWSDTYRLKIRTGMWDRRTREAAVERLGEDGVERLENEAENRDTTYAIVVQHVNRMPERGELNLVMYADPNRESITLQPWTDGDREDQLAQKVWFQTMYADTGPLAMLTHYTQGGLEGVVRSTFEKSFYVGPLWGELESYGLLDALASGVRVTVPYPGPPLPETGSSHVHSNGEYHQLVTAEDLARMGYQAMILEAGEELRRAAARQMLQNVLAEMAASEMEGYGLLGALGAFATRTTASLAGQADTRAWQMLPAEIRVARITLEPGEHELELDQGLFLGGQSGVSKRAIFKAEPGSVRLLQTRWVDEPALVKELDDSERIDRRRQIEFN